MLRVKAVVGCRATHINSRYLYRDLSLSNAIRSLVDLRHSSEERSATRFIAILDNFACLKLWHAFSPETPEPRPARLCFASQKALGSIGTRGLAPPRTLQQEGSEIEI